MYAWMKMSVTSNKTAALREERTLCGKVVSLYKYILIRIWLYHVPYWPILYSLPQFQKGCQVVIDLKKMLGQLYCATPLAAAIHQHVRCVSALWMYYKAQSYNTSMPTLLSASCDTLYGPLTCDVTITTNNSHHFVLYQSNDHGTKLNVLSINILFWMEMHLLRILSPIFAHWKHLNWQVTSLVGCSHFCIMLSFSSEDFSSQLSSKALWDASIAVPSVSIPYPVTVIRQSMWCSQHDGEISVNKRPLRDTGFTQPGDEWLLSFYLRSYGSSRNSYNITNNLTT